MESLGLLAGPFLGLAGQALHQALEAALGPGEGALGLRTQGGLPAHPLLGLGSAGLGLLHPLLGLLEALLPCLACGLRLRLANPRARLGLDPAAPFGGLAAHLDRLARVTLNLGAAPLGVGRAALGRVQGIAGLL